MSKCHKIKITTGSLAGEVGYQITDDQGNATWELISGEIEAPWA